MSDSVLILEEYITSLTNKHDVYNPLVKKFIWTKNIGRYSTIKMNDPETLDDDEKNLVSIVEEIIPNSISILSTMTKKYNRHCLSETLLEKILAGPHKDSPEALLLKSFYRNEQLSDEELNKIYRDANIIGRYLSHFKLYDNLELAKIMIECYSPNEAARIRSYFLNLRPVLDRHFTELENGTNGFLYTLRTKSEKKIRCPDFEQKMMKLGHFPCSYVASCVYDCWKELENNMDLDRMTLEAYISNVYTSQFKIVPDDLVKKLRRTTVDYNIVRI